MKDLRTDVVRAVEGLIEFNRVLQSVLEDPVESEQSSSNNRSDFIKTIHVPKPLKNF